MNKHAGEIDKLLESYRQRKLKIIQQTAAMALAHFKKSFTNHGFTDVSLKKWPERKGGPRNQGRSVLINRGVLKRGLRIKKTDYNGAIVGVDDAVKYAQIHNDGGEIPVTPKMRRFFWAMYYKTGGKNKRTKSGELPQFWLRMALTKSDTIKIPKRQYIGDSVTLERKMISYVEQELKILFHIT